ncbi:putative ATPase [Mycolicibacterium novocastrense]|uniref:ATPase n=1 Tax=Mycolicibacterium novocastrense TaxID=59813 RepID=A0ABQ0KST8_MYCNV|nr:putative ATPase [Mycolicibacterium novocastrense]
MELGVLGPLQVRQYGLPVAIPGAKPRAVLTMLGLHGGSVVSAAALVALLWGDDPPRTATKALQTHISSLRRALGDGFVLTEGSGWTLSTTEIDAIHYKSAARLGRKALAAGDPTRAVTLFDQALALWRGIPELPDSSRGSSEKTRWLEGHAALVEDRADALLATGRAAEIVGELESAIAEAPLRERRWGHLMLALYRAGRQGEALGAYKRARSLLVDELGVEPGPELRRLEAAIVAQDAALEVPQSQQLTTVTRAVTFLLTDIEGSTAAWEADADAMAVALARHDEIVEQVVTSRGGRLVKTRGEGDATFSVFDRPSAAAAAAIELQGAVAHEDWRLAEPMRIRVALHTGEVEFRDGDYFGRAVNRAARLRSLAVGGQILCSGATAELVIDSLPDDVVLADLGTRRLRNLPRPEHVFELRMETADDPSPPTAEAPMVRPALPAVLVGPGPFVGRGRELERLVSAWQSTLAAGTRAVLIAGEPGVGKTRLAGEWSRQAYEQGAVVLYGRCDEDLGAPYQPFAEALRSLVSCVDSNRLRNVRGVEALLPLVPGLADALPDVTAPPRADPDTERYAMFDAVVALLGAASATAPVVLILDDLHWAAKPTLLLLRHLLRFGEEARVQIVGTYRSTDLDRSHPLAAMLADLHRDGTATRLQLSGLDEGDVTAYVAEAGYDDEELGRALATVTGGNPFFLIEALRHVEESGGRWDPSTLPQGVREAVSRRLSRLTAETNKALAAAAVVGSRFALTLVERVVGEDLVDAFDEAGKAGIVIEEPGGRYRFNHALVRQSLLAELPSVRRMRLHQRIAGTLEAEPGDDDELVAELAYHYFECAWAGNAAKAVEYCRRAADQAMSRVAYEGAADLYDRALHALEELDDELPDRDDLQAELLIAHCEALLAAGDVTSAKVAVMQLRDVAGDSGRLGAWGTCFDGELSMLTDPERLDEIESAVGVAAQQLGALDDAAGEAKAHTVRAGCLARLGRIGDCETALDQALTAARRAREHGRVNAVLAGAPLAALWGPNPVPRAGGRCLDVVRLLRITTGSPLVEATSTRCQAVLDAFRGRATEGRRLIESARRALTELGLRHALLEVDQFAGIIELVADDAAAAEPYLRRAYEGFRRMGLDTDTADTAALLARACLALDRDAEADEMCAVSERLAGHGSKASIAWRSVRAQLLARAGVHDRAKQVAEEAVSLAAATDALVDHGDACLALATVLRIAGDRAGMRAAAEQAIALYERKGAAALAEKARRVLGARSEPPTPADQVSRAEPENACVRIIRRLAAAADRQAWEEYRSLYAPDVTVESRRKMVGFTKEDLAVGDWPRLAERVADSETVRHRHSVIAVRGERLALCRLTIGGTEVRPDAPQEDVLELYALDNEGRIARRVWFDAEDLDTALAELDAASQGLAPQLRELLENGATRADERFNALFAARRWDDIAALLTEDLRIVDHRPGLRRESNDRATELAEVRAIAELGTKSMTSQVIAIRGNRLALVRTLYTGRDMRPEAFHTELLRIVEISDEERLVAYIAFDPDDFDAAIGELDARYLAGEAAPFADTWSVVAGVFASLARHEVPPSTQDFLSIDHRPGTPLAHTDLRTVVANIWDVTPDLQSHIETVHRLDHHGALCTQVSRGRTAEGFPAEWRMLNLTTVDGSLVSGCELFDETDLDVAIARFEELRRPERQLENAASRAAEQFLAHFQADDWKAMSELFAETYLLDDRRRIISSGIRHGHDHAIEDLRAVVDVGLWAELSTSTIATRGGRLVLLHLHAAGPDPGASQSDLLQVVEVDNDGRFSAVVVFDVNDIDTAFDELERRYLSGEAATHTQAWSVIAGAYAAVLRHELPRTTPDWVNVDHRRVTSFAPNELEPFLKATWDVLENDIKIYVQAVHRLTDLGAVVTRVIKGTSREGFTAEWREIGLSTVDRDRINRSEIFDETDLDVALARFDELERPSALKNVASDVINRYCASFDARDWATMAETLAEDVITDDRRRVVNAGVRRGRDVHIADMRATAEVSGARVSSTVLAIRGERLVLNRVRVINRNESRDDVSAQMLSVTEINPDKRATAVVAFDDDNFDGAFQELDARYLAGEASDNAQTWSAVVESFAAVNRGVVPEVAPGCINLDHRCAVAFAPGEIGSYTVAAQANTPDFNTYIEAVHRLDVRGAVVSYVAKGTSAQGFQAEWRGVSLSIVDGRLVNRVELFDEPDLEVALAQFDELNCPAATYLENTASRAVERFQTCFANRDWEAMAEVLADDVAAVDHRPVMGAGLRFGRALNIGDWQSVAEVGFTTVTSTMIATRGERLTMGRFHISTGDNTYHNDVLGIVEIDAFDRIATCLMFDDTDMDAAFQELESRYLAGEAASYARTWSVILTSYEKYDRHELPPTTPDWANIDHRRVTTMPAGELLEHSQATWDVTPDAKIYFERVHRLNDVGAVFTQVVSGTSQEGFEAEWRMVDLVMIEGDLICRCEIFDDSDLDIALARFDELTPPARPVNVAYQMVERLWSCFAKRDWSATGELLAPDVRAEDRRRIVNDGLRQGREAFVANMRAVAEVGIDDVTSAVVATRGERLVLARVRAERFHSDVLNLLELDAAQTFITSTVVFDMEDLDAAFTELDARYGAGEAAAHGRTWTMLANAIAAFNRHELPTTTPDWVNIDHRSGTSIAPGQLFPYVRTSWELAPDITNYIEAVHRLNDFGAIVTRVATGTSQEGFNAEWRVITLATFDGDLLSRVELFDETDLDAALARFEELRPPTPVSTNVATKVDQRSLTRLENGATRALANLWVCFDAQDWDAVQAAMAEDFASYDRRQVVNAGVRRGRAIHIENMRSVGEVGFKNAGSPAIATRGERLALCRSRFTAGQGPRGEIVAEALMIIETDAANRLVSNTVFDLDALNEAFAELDAKYAAGEAMPHAQTWSVVTRAYAALNRQEQFERDWIYTDHRRGTPFASTSSATSAHPDVWDVTPDLNAHIEVVHRLTEAAVLVTSVVGGSSQDGFEAEWRFVQLLTVARDRIKRCELFDETDIDTAIARFNELCASPTHLDNAAVRVRARVADAYNRRDTETFAAGAVGRYEDRRRGLHDEGITDAKYALAVLSETPASWKLSIEPVAVRGDRLALTREAFRDTNDSALPITVELIVLTEVADEEADLHTVFFDSDDADAAFKELDRRFVAGEAAPYSHTWSAIAESYAAFNRRKIPSAEPAWVDHRLLATIQSGDLIANVGAAWDLVPDIKAHIATVHRLSELGAVIDILVRGSSREGFDAEYHEIAVVTVRENTPDRFEMFDADNLDAAFARLDELSREPRIENAATRFWTVVVDAFNRRDVETVLNLLSDDGCQEDRRIGLRAKFRGAERRRAVEAMFTTAPASWRIEVEPIAVRGSLLALMRQRYRDSASTDHQVVVELLSVTEMRDNTVVHDTVDFDADDISSAMRELESRYVAGEAAPFTKTWSLVVRTYDAFNRHKLSPTTEGWVNIDHRPVIASAPGDVHAYVRESWEVASDISTRIEAVHRLSGIGAVFTHAESGTSREGFVAEWREVTLLTFDGDAITRCEIFSEDDLDAALARFDELSQRAPRIENAATRMWERLADAFNHRDIDEFLTLTSPDGRIDDRRKGLQAMHDPSDRRRAAQALFEAPRTWRLNVDHIAIRGSRLSLAHQIYRDTRDDSQPVTIEHLAVVEINDDGLMHDFVNFDSDDLDAAFEELETRYLASEAAAHAGTWSAIADGYAVFNRRELFRTTPDWVNIDHRRGGTAFAPGEQSALILATWDVVRKIHVYPEVIHRLDTLGAVFTQIVQATSQEGFDGEWREITLLTVTGDAISRCEVFDEADLDAALARFDELNRATHRLDNAATRTRARLVDAFAHRDLDTFSCLLTPDGRYDDRRKGLRDTGSLKEEFVPTMLSEAPASWQWTDEPIAIRGQRLALCRDWFRDTNAPGHPVTVDDLSLTEITEEGLVCHSVIFDSDDLDAAMRELDARWTASGEVAHSDIIEAHRRNLEMTNRHDWDALTAVCAGASYINHRQLGSSTADYIASIRTLASLAPDLSIESAEILAYSELGVATHVVVRGTSTAGLAIEVPFLLINLWHGDHVTHIEAFDLEDRDHALERFKELNESG